MLSVTARKPGNRPGRSQRFYFRGTMALQVEFQAGFGFSDVGNCVHDIPSGASELRRAFRSGVSPIEGLGPKVQKKNSFPVAAPCSATWGHGNGEERARSPRGAIAKVLLPLKAFITSFDHCVPDLKHADPSPCIHICIYTWLRPRT